MIFSSGDLGRLLRCWREHRNLTLQQVADLPEIDGSSAALSLAESGVFWEAQQRLARLFFFELEEFEAEELRGLDSAEDLAGALYTARKSLRLGPELLCERTGLSAGTIKLVESKSVARSVIKYAAYALADAARDPELLERLIVQSLAPWYWRAPKPSRKSA